MADPETGSGASLLGVGTAFVVGVRPRPRRRPDDRGTSEAPAFFRGETCPGADLTRAGLRIGAQLLRPRRPHRGVRRRVDVRAVGGCAASLTAAAPSTAQLAPITTIGGSIRRRRPVAVAWPTAVIRWWRCCARRGGRTAGSVPRRRRAGITSAPRIAGTSNRRREVPASGLAWRPTGLAARPARPFPVARRSPDRAQVALRNPRTARSGHRHPWPAPWRTPGPRPTSSGRLAPIAGGSETVLADHDRRVGVLERRHPVSRW